MEALVTHERGIHDLCGLHESLASDPALFFTFEDRTCPMCAGLSQYGRMQQRRDEAIRKSHGEHRAAGAPDPADGRRTFIRLMGADEIEQMQGGSRGNQT